MWDEVWVQGCSPGLHHSVPAVTETTFQKLACNWPRKGSKKKGKSALMLACHKVPVPFSNSFFLALFSPPFSLLISLPQSESMLFKISLLVAGEWRRQYDKWSFINLHSEWFASCPLRPPKERKGSRKLLMAKQLLGPKFWIRDSSSPVCLRSSLYSTLFIYDNGVLKHSVSLHNFCNRSYVCLRQEEQEQFLEAQLLAASYYNHESRRRETDSVLAILQFICRREVNRPQYVSRLNVLQVVT